MGLSVENTIRRIRNQASLLSWLMELAGGDAPDQPWEAVGDICDDMKDLADRLKATLEDMPEALSADLVEWEHESEDGE
jgi:hypothetical protein